MTLPITYADRTLILETNPDIRSLNHVNWSKTNLTRTILATMLMAATNVAVSNEFSKTYIDSPDQDKQPASIYKFTGSDGQITYSTTAPNDFIQIEEITITGPPSDSYANDTRQRYNKLKLTAEELGDAREQREAIREEDEKKRLERLALLNQSKPQPVYERNLYVGYPYRLWKTRRHSNPYLPKQPVHLPARTPNRGHRPSTMPLPPSSFPPIFER